MSTDIAVYNLLEYRIYKVPVSDIEVADDFRRTLTNHSKVSEDELSKWHFFSIVEVDAEDALDDPKHVIKGVEGRDDIPKNGFIISLNLFRLGKSVINNYSFQFNDPDITSLILDRYSVLSCYKTFIDSLSSIEFELKEYYHLLESCKSNRYIRRNIGDYVLNNSDVSQIKLTTVSELLESVKTNLASEEFFTSADLLIRSCKILTYHLCKEIHTSIEEHDAEKADVLVRGNKIDLNIENSNIMLTPKLFDGLSDDTFGSSIDYLARGAYGTVFRYNISKYKSVIIKKQRKGQIYTLTKPSWFREFHYTKHLHHDNVIKYLLKPFIYLNHYYCIMEDGGISLSEKYYQDHPVEEADLLQIIKQIGSAIKYLHHDVEEIVIHCDIRTSNVTQTLVQPCRYKLIDFGLCSKKTHYNSDLDSDPYRGHELWKGPEEVRGRKSDVWSFGVFMLELLSFPKHPSHFYATPPTPVCHKAFPEYINTDLRGYYRELAKNQTGLTELLLKCCEIDPGERISALDVFEIVKDFQ